MSEFLPFALPLIGEEEIAEVVDTLRSGWLTTGPKTKRFEENFAKAVNGGEAIAVNSATAGLHLALEAFGIGPGDKVLTTAMTFTASAEVIRYLGADPVFVDVDPDTLNIDPAEIRKVLAREKGIKMIMPVHIAGQACDMDEIMTIAREHNLTVVEDAAHAFPTTYRGKMIGEFGDATVYSFYVTKTLATGEGGMVVTRNAEAAKRMKVMRLHGISKDAFDRYTANRPSWYYEIIAPGFKYNMPDLAAAIGLHQLDKGEAMRKRREEIAMKYNEAFADLPLKRPHVSIPEDTHAWHLYIIQLELEKLDITRDQFIEKMCEHKIGTSVHFIPLHMQPYWRDRYGLRDEDFPKATAAFQRITSLPIYPKMTDADVQRVIDAVREILG